MAGRGIDHGLIGPREAERLWERHILNSAAIAPLISQGSRVVDVGSGAGLPGLPLAILRPDLDVTLLEPLLRRTRFLADTVAELGLGNRVRVIRARAEDHRDRYDVVTARAVAPLGRLAPWCAPLLARDGVVLALKGSTAADEVDAARDQLRRASLTADLLDVTQDPLGDPSFVVRLAPTR